MAVVEGISALIAGDGTTNGKMALDIQTGVLRILYGDTAFAYKTATIANPKEVATGSVTYQLPWILQAENYGIGASQPQGINSEIVTVPVDIRRTVKYTYEQFDIARLGSWVSIIGMISNSVARSIENDLNAHFWTFVTTQLNLTNGTLRTQNLVVSNLLPDMANIAAYTMPDPDLIRADLAKIQLLAVKLSKTYDMKTLGIRKSELMTYFAPEVDVQIRQSYWNQPNKLSERIVADNLVGVQMGGGLYYYTDPMLNNSIPAGSSYSKDLALDTQKFIGVVVHNEAVAMPFSFNSVQVIPDQNSGNPRTICKYQFGLGMLRPHLIYSLTSEAPQP